MMDYTAHSALSKLPELVKKQRRCVAAQIRITTEDQAHRKEMLSLLVEAGADVVECGDYVIRRATARDGSPTTKVERKEPRS